MNFNHYIYFDIHSIFKYNNSKNIYNTNIIITITILMNRVRMNIININRNAMFIVNQLI